MGNVRWSVSVAVHNNHFATGLPALRRLRRHQRHGAAGGEAQTPFGRPSCRGLSGFANPFAICSCECHWVNATRAGTERLGKVGQSKSESLSGKPTRNAVVSDGGGLVPSKLYKFFNFIPIFVEESTDPFLSPFHITRVDRAYNIQCAYQEPERMLSTQIDVRLAFVSPSPIPNPLSTYPVLPQPSKSATKCKRPSASIVSMARPVPTKWELLLCCLSTTVVSGAQCASGRPGGARVELPWAASGSPGENGLPFRAAHPRLFCGGWEKPTGPGAGQPRLFPRPADFAHSRLFRQFPSGNRSFQSV